MTRQTVAIVGLGRVGSLFLDGLLHQQNDEIAVVAVSENMDTPGKELAESHEIPVVAIDELIAMGEAIDIMFDLTGNPGVRKELREKLQSSKNQHTIIATEAIARLIWSLISSGAGLPRVHEKTGY